MRRTRQAGAFLIMAIVILTVVALMTVTLAYLSSASTGSGILQNIGDKAYYVALSGLERATAASATPVLADRTACAAQTGAGFTNIAVGSGVFTVSNPAVGYNGGSVAAPAPTTLSAGITAIATVVPVASVAGYAGTGGRIMIDRELIDYAATSISNAVCGVQPCFVVARRGAENTTAAAHAAATRVGQYQCRVQVAGGVPNLPVPPLTSTRRTLTQATQLSEAWAAGAQAVAGTTPMTRFLDTAWSESTLAFTHAGNGITSISMLSYADGFAVGTPGTLPAQQPLVLRWSGSAWALIATGLATNRTLNSISCVAANDCWALGVEGAVAASQPWVIRWNGAWTNNAKGTLAAATVTLNSVHCAAANECWAVGNAVGGGEYFIRITAASAPNWTKPAASAAIANVNFNGVYCRDTSNCWAVGAASNIVRWDGAAWATEAIGGAAFTAILNSVWCTSGSDCWAVGNTPTAGAAGEVIVRRQAGAAPNWTRVAPSAGIPDVNLTKVACASGNDCWAVGVNSGGELILRWDGSSWTRRAVSALLANRNLNALAVIGPASRPYAARQELFP